LANGKQICQNLALFLLIQSGIIFGKIVGQIFLQIEYAVEFSFGTQLKVVEIDLKRKRKKAKSYFSKTEKGHIFRPFLISSLG